MIEIERKFLVRGDFPRTDGTRIVQGYLSRVPERTVRVRITRPVGGDIAGNVGRGYITIKGVSDAAGVSRFEWEREIAVEEARALLKLAEPGIIEKTRWRVPVASRRGTGGHHVFEVDEFHEGGGCGDEARGGVAGDESRRKGLILAEIELSSADEHFERPAWLGDEVTGDARYYNAAL